MFSVGSDQLLKHLRRHTPALSNTLNAPVPEQVVVKRPMHFPFHRGLASMKLVSHETRRPRKPSLSRNALKSTWYLCWYRLTQSLRRDAGIAVRAHYLRGQGPKVLSRGPQARMVSLPM